MDWKRDLTFKNTNVKVFVLSGVVIIAMALLFIFILIKQMQPAPLTSYSLLESDSEISAEMSAEMVTEREVEPESILKHIYVDIKGAVYRPGVYQLEEGSRLFDLIDLAGGLGTEAYQDGINLAQRLEDQMMVRIYKTAEMESVLNAQVPDLLVASDDTNSIMPPSISLHQPPSSESNNLDTLININTASAVELESLPNIGPKKAQDIILFRETNGSFQDTEELLNVSGIGNKTYASLEALITVGP